MTIRVLVVEDEPLLAIELASELSQAGFGVVGPVNSVARALVLLKDLNCDAALLDVNLGKETSEPVALALREMGTPFLVMSGYARDELPAGFGGARLFSKPIKPADLCTALRSLVIDSARSR